MQRDKPGATPTGTRGSEKDTRAQPKNVPVSTTKNEKPNGSDQLDENDDPDTPDSSQ